MLAADRGQFEALCSDQLSYGHSAGRIETKSQFIDAATSGRSVWKFITLTDQTTPGRRRQRDRPSYLDRRERKRGQANAIKIGVLMVWLKQDSRWKLLARQAFRI